MKLPAREILVLAVSLMSALPAFAKADSSSSSQIEHNKETARLWWVEVIQHKDLKVIDKILAKDAVQELAPSYVSPLNGSNKFTGIESIKKHMEKVHSRGSYPAANPIVIAEGNRVAVLREVTEKMNDGSNAVIPWVTFFEFDKDGKISHMIHVHDTLHEKNQLEKSAKKS